MTRKNLRDEDLVENALPEVVLLANWAVVFGAVIAILTFHRDSNTRKLNLFWEIWKDVCEQKDKLEALDAKKTKGKEEEEDKEYALTYQKVRLVNSLEFLAMNFNRGLIHRKLCETHSSVAVRRLLSNKAGGLTGLLNSYKYPILREVRLMDYVFQNQEKHKVITYLFELTMPLPIWSTLTLKLNREIFWYFARRAAGKGNAFRGIKSCSNSSEVKNPQEAVGIGEKMDIFGVLRKFWIGIALMATLLIAGILLHLAGVAIDKLAWGDYALVLTTLAYVFLTQEMLEESRQANRLQHTPILIPRSAQVYLQKRVLQVEISNYGLGDAYDVIIFPILGKTELRPNMIECVPAKSLRKMVKFEINSDELIEQIGNMDCGGLKLRVESRAIFGKLPPIKEGIAYSIHE